MPKGNTDAGAVSPIDYDRVRRIFGEENPPPPQLGRFNCAGRYIMPDRVCLECATLGHICRAHRAERYHAQQAAKAPPPRRRAQHGHLYRMWWAFPIAFPLAIASAFAIGVYFTLGMALLVDYL